MLKEPKFRTEQIECFKDQGFVIFPKAFNVAEMQTIQDWTVELTEFPEEPGRHWVYYEDQPGRQRPLPYQPYREHDPVSCGIS